MHRDDKCPSPEIKGEYLTCRAGAADVCRVVYLGQRVLDDPLCLLHSSLQTGPASCNQLALQSLLPALLQTNTHTFNMSNKPLKLITEHYVNIFSQLRKERQFPTFSLSWFCRASAVFTPLSLSVARELWIRWSSSPWTSSSASTFDKVCTSSTFSDSRTASWELRTSLDCSKEQKVLGWKMDKDKDGYIRFLCVRLQQVWYDGRAPATEFIWSCLLQQLCLVGLFVESYGFSWDIWAEVKLTVLGQLGSWDCATLLQYNNHWVLQQRAVTSDPFYWSPLTNEYKWSNNGSTVEINSFKTYCLRVSRSDRKGKRKKQNRSNQ